MKNHWVCDKFCPCDLMVYTSLQNVGPLKNQIIFMRCSVGTGRTFLTAGKLVYQSDSEHCNI